MKKVVYREGKNAVIYARYSCDKQTEQSIEGEIRECNSFAQKEGYSIIEIYTDAARTGTDTARPQLQAMLSDIEDGSVEADVVIVYKLDRLSRDQLDTLTIKAQLDSCGVRILRAKEVNAEGASGVLTTALDMAIAQYYSVELAEKTARGMRECALKCSSTGASAPLGYKWVDKKLVVDELKSEIIPIIFDMYAEGKSKKQIADYLNIKGYSNKKGKPFAFSDFENLLKCKKYIGVWEYKGEIISENGCTPLVNKAVFAKVQEMLQHNKKYGSQHKQKARVYSLAGRIYCGCCGGQMIASGGRGRSGNYYYYTCKACKINVRHDAIEEYVYNQTAERFALATTTAERLADEIIKQYETDNVNAEVQTREKELKNIKVQIDNICNAVAENPTITSLFVKLKELEDKSKNLEEIIS